MTRQNEIAEIPVIATLPICHLARLVRDRNARAVATCGSRTHSQPPYMKIAAGRAAIRALSVVVDRVAHRVKQCPTAGTAPWRRLSSRRGPLCGFLGDCAVVHFE